MIPDPKRLVLPPPPIAALAVPTSMHADPSPPPLFQTLKNAETEAAAKTEPDVNSLQTREYLDKTVVPVLLEGLVRIATLIRPS